MAIYQEMSASWNIWYLATTDWDLRVTRHRKSLSFGTPSQSFSHLVFTTRLLVSSQPAGNGPKC